MTDASFSVLDLLDLPPLERELFLHLARNGPNDAQGLAAATGHDEAAVREALLALSKRRRLELQADGQFGVVMGKVSKGRAHDG